MKLRRIDVLKVIDNKGETKEFHEDDIVKIGVSYSNIWYKGRIAHIDTLYLRLDYSEKFKQRDIKIDYEKIDSIEVIEDEI